MFKEHLAPTLFFSVRFYTLPYKFEGVFRTKEGVIIHSMHILFADSCENTGYYNEIFVLLSALGVGSLLASFTELHLVQSENVLVEGFIVGVTGMSMFCSHLFKG